MNTSTNNRRKTMATKKLSTIAQERRDEIQASLERVRTFKADEQAKVERIDGDRAAGKLGTDFTGRSTAVANVTDAEGQEAYLLGLLDVAEQNLASYLLADSVGDLLSQREALESKREESIQTIRKALDEYTEAVEAHNSDLAGLIGDARRAGLIEGEADPTLPVLFGGGEYGHPRALIVNGERYAAVRADQEAVVREARK